jgi:hypothetical protein
MGQVMEINPIYIPGIGPEDMQSSPGGIFLCKNTK